MGKKAPRLRVLLDRPGWTAPVRVEIVDGPEHSSCWCNPIGSDIRKCPADWFWAVYA